MMKNFIVALEAKNASIIVVMYYVDLYMLV